MINRTAYKVNVKNLLDAEIKEDGEISYIELGKIKASLFNIIGTIVSLEDKGAFKDAAIDDSTGCIPLRVFSESVKFDIGDTAQVIGRLREFNAERYITSVIAKKIDRGWFLVRREELKDSSYEKISEDEKANKKEKAKDWTRAVLNSINKLDDGSGVFLESIDDDLGHSCSNIINKLLEEGEVFEIEPGRVKCLR